MNKRWHFKTLDTRRPRSWLTSHLYDALEQRCGAWPSIRCMEFNKYGKYPFGGGAVRNREGSLIWRSSKYTFLWPTVRITEVSVIRRAVIERFHCTPFKQNKDPTGEVAAARAAGPWLAASSWQLSRDVFQNSQERQWHTSRDIELQVFRVNFLAELKAFRANLIEICNTPQLSGTLPEREATKKRIIFSRHCSYCKRR